MATIKSIKKTEPNKGLVIQQIVQVNVDRTMKDVASLRAALVAAESIYYPNRSRLYDLYADVDLDGHLTGIVGKRISAVKNKSWRFATKDGQEVEAVMDFINTNNFRKIVGGIMLSLFWGVTGMEFIPGEKIKFKFIPRKHIKPETEVIIMNQSDQDGKSYADISNIFVVGEEREYGLFLKVAFYALLKKGDFGDWAQYIEIFGQPMRIGRYDAYDEKTKTQLSEALTNMGNSLAIMIPRQADFELMDGKVSNGDGQLQERFKNACNNEMSIAILGNTETTSNDNGGSNSKAKEQGKQQLEITMDDIAFTRNILNSENFLAILKSYGLPVDGGKFTVESEIDVAELLINAEVDSKLKEMGLLLDDDYFYKAYNRPRPANYDAMKKEKELEQEPPPLPENKPGDKQPQPGKNPLKKPVNAKLSAWQNLRMAAANFFAPARKD